MTKRDESEEGGRKGAELELPYILKGKFPHLITNIDKLYKLVLERKRVRISAAARMFSVKPAKIEEWGKILEEYELLSLHYPMVGEPEITVRGLKIRGPRKKGIRVRKEGKFPKHRKISKRIIINYIIIILIGEVLIYLTLVRPVIAIDFFFNYLIPLSPHSFLIAGLLYTIVAAAIAIELAVFFRKKKKGKLPAGGLTGQKPQAGLAKTVKPEMRLAQKKHSGLFSFFRLRSPRPAHAPFHEQKKEPRHAAPIQPKPAKTVRPKSIALINYLIIALIAILMVYIILYYLGVV